MLLESTVEQGRGKEVIPSLLSLFNSFLQTGAVTVIATLPLFKRYIPQKFFHIILFRTDNRKIYLGREVKQRILPLLVLLVRVNIWVIEERYHLKSTLSQFLKWK